MPGAFRPRRGRAPRWDVDVLRRIRARSLAALRREVSQQSSAAALGRLPGRLAGDRSGPRRRRRLARSNRVASRARPSRPRSWTAMSCPRASAATVPPTSTRSVPAASWSRISAGAVGRRTTGTCACSSGNAPPARANVPTSYAPVCALRDAIRAQLADRGAGSGGSSSWRPARRTRRRSSGRSGTLSAVGEVTNDTLAPLRAYVAGTGWRRPRAGAGRVPVRCGAGAALRSRQVVELVSSLLRPEPPPPKAR